MEEKSIVYFFSSDGDDNYCEEFLTVEDALYEYELCSQMDIENFSSTLLKFEGKKRVLKLEDKEIESFLTRTKFGYL